MSRVSWMFVGLWLLPLCVSAQMCPLFGVPATTPTERFTSHTDGTVTDTQTGLMWKQCPEGLGGTDCTTGVAQTFTWQAALQQAQTLNMTGGFAGFTDWRLPNIKELRSLIERQCHDPAINLNVFPNTTSTEYWSSSPVANYGGNAWFVHFRDGGGDYLLSGKSGAFQVRLVRDAQ